MSHTDNANPALCSDVTLPIHLRLRNYMIKHGYVFKVIADKSGIKQDRFYKLLDGSYKMEADELEAICRRGLGVNPAIFFGDQFSEIENCS